MDDSDDPVKRAATAANGSGATGPDAGARVRELEAALDAAREEARQSHERWLRERADAENLKKRTARERADTTKFANERLLKDLLPIVDNLQRAIEHARGGGDGASLVEGVALVLKGLVEVLERHGVTRVETRGAPFDPAHHEAMAHVESAEHAPNSVIEEHDRLLRPALVSVAKPPAGAAKLAKDQSDD
jgi:molecular chaperone GrpE